MSLYRRTGVVVFTLLLASLNSRPATAQVGHAPESSPYSDLRARQAISIFGGYVGGSGGRVGVGPSDGPLTTVRYDRALGGPMDIQIGISFATLQRLVVDPDQAPQFRVSGPVDQNLVMMEAGLGLVLTGRRTWHALAPYVGASIGVGFETALSSDLTGYQFGTKFVASPQVGIKWFPVQALTIRVEGRNLMWRLKYPERWYNAPVLAPDTPPVLLPNDPIAEWTHHPTLTIAVGYTFAR